MFVVSVTYSRINEMVDGGEPAGCCCCTVHTLFYLLLFSRYTQYDFICCCRFFAAMLLLLFRFYQISKHESENYYTHTRTYTCLCTRIQLLCTITVLFFKQDFFINSFSVVVQQPGARVMKAHIHRLHFATHRNTPSHHITLIEVDSAAEHKNAKQVKSYTHTKIKSKWEILLTAAGIFL